MAEINPGGSCPSNLRCPLRGLTAPIAHLSVRRVPPGQALDDRGMKGDRYSGVETIECSLEWGGVRGPRVSAKHARWRGYGCRSAPPTLTKSTISVIAASSALPGSASAFGIWVGHRQFVANGLMPSISLSRRGSASRSASISAFNPDSLVSPLTIRNSAAFRDAMAKALTLSPFRSSSIGRRSGGADGASNTSSMCHGSMSPIALRTGDSPGRSS
jgi:hypothetical protein